MNATEIILLILGFASVSISFFVGNKKLYGEEPETEESENVSRNIWTEKEEKMVREQVSTILQEEKENILADTIDSLNRKSNEKIMEFDEFSTQVLEKINHNHEEVVFMYSMLNEKEKQLKDEVVQRTVQKKEQNIAKKEEPQQVAEAKETKAAPTKKTAKKRSDSSESQKNKMTGEKKAENVSEVVGEKVEEKENVGSSEKILSMYKQGKSVLEISKELNMGQGEVKLMIALYGGNK